MKEMNTNVGMNLPTNTTSNYPVLTTSASEGSISTSAASSAIIPILVVTVVVAAITLAVVLPITIHNTKSNKEKKIIGPATTTETIDDRKNDTDNRNSTGNRSIIEYEYGCLTDSGSSSSREYVYKWPKINQNSIVILTQVAQSDKILPALGRTKNNSEVEIHANQLIDFCETQIKEKSNNIAILKDSPFYLKATAGMRKLTQEEQNSKIQKVREVVKNSKKFKFEKDEWIRVIEGSDEGIYGWITVNYLTNVLSENDKAKKINKKTFGVIDIGGSSMEVTFIPEKENESYNKISVPLGSIEYKLYSHLYDFLGQDDAFEQILKNLIDENRDTEQIQHPCLLNGYTENYTQNEKTYIFTGKYSYEGCSNLVKKLLNQTNQGEIDDYFYNAINDEKQPIITEDQKIYAISAPSFVAGFLGIDNNSYKSPTDLLTKTKEFCNKNWEEAKNEHPDVNINYVKIYCFSGNYFYNIFVNGLGIKENWKNIIFSNSIEKTDLVWALGAMIFETSAL